MGPRFSLDTVALPGIGPPLRVIAQSDQDDYEACTDLNLIRGGQTIA